MHNFLQHNLLLILKQYCRQYNCQNFKIIFKVLPKFHKYFTTVERDINIYGMNIPDNNNVSMAFLSKLTTDYCLI